MIIEIKRDKRDKRENKRSESIYCQRTLYGVKQFTTNEICQMSHLEFIDIKVLKISLRRGLVNLSRGGLGYSFQKGLSTR